MDGWETLPSPGGIAVPAGGRRNVRRTVFRVLSRNLSIETDDDLVSTYLREAYGRLIATPEPIVPLDHAAILTGGVTPCVRFDGKPIPVDATLDRTSFAFAGANCVFRRCFLRDRAHSAWYAAGIMANGTGVLLSAPSGTGKTTLTLELLRRGYGLYGDEYVFVRRADRMLVGIRRALMVRDGDTIRHDIDPDVLFGRPVFAPPAPLGSAFLLERGSRSLVLPLSPLVFAMSIAPRVGHHEEGLERLSSLVAMLTNVTCYRLVMADTASAAEALLETVYG